MVKDHQKEGEETDYKELEEIIGKEKVTRYFTLLELPSTVKVEILHRV